MGPGLPSDKRGEEEVYETLIAPPHADFQKIYAAGHRELTGNILNDIPTIKKAVGYYGTYDFQRDKALNTLFEVYIPAANYAVGVYMAGGGYGLAETRTLAEGYAYTFTKIPNKPFWWVWDVLVDFCR